MAQELISSKHNEKIKMVSKLCHRKGREKTKKFILEGEKAILEAYLANFEIESVFCLESEKHKYKFVENLYIVSDKDILKKISTTYTAPKAVGVANQLEVDIDCIKTKKTIALFENIKDLGNLGTIIRSSVAFGVDAIILTGNTVDIYNPKLVRTSVGNFMKIPVFNLCFEDIKSIFPMHRIVATVLDSKTSLKQFKRNYEYLIFAFGSESEGLSEKMLEISDEKITIEMSKKVESLNLGVAASIIFYINNMSCNFE